MLATVPSRFEIDDGSEEEINVHLFTTGERTSKLKKPKKAKEKVFEDPTLEGIANYILTKPCRNILVLSGAGVSTNSGIPDMRTPNSGLYFSLVDNNLPYVHAFFDSHFFKKDPRPFYRMLRGCCMFKNFKPSLSHYFIALLERKKVLLKNYTQNMDDLEELAGLSEDKLAQINGSFNRFSCLRCKVDKSSSLVQQALDNGQIPLCECSGTVRPNVHLYGDAMSKVFCSTMAKDFTKCDLLIILGTSLSDEPVASMPFLVAKECPRLVINTTELSRSLDFDFLGPFSKDVMVLGDCDVGCQRLADLLGWSSELKEILEDTLNMNLSQCKE